MIIAFQCTAATVAAVAASYAANAYVAAAAKAAVKSQASNNPNQNRYLNYRPRELSTVDFFPNGNISR
jgi:hypothetical protein